MVCIGITDYELQLPQTEEKAEKLSRKYSQFSSIDSFISQEHEYDIVINASSAGLTGKFSPINELITSENTIFYDLNYSLAETPFCKWAKENSPKTSWIASFPCDTPFFPESVILKFKFLSISNGTFLKPTNPNNSSGIS